MDKKRLKELLESLIRVSVPYFFTSTSINYIHDTIMNVEDNEVFAEFMVSFILEVENSGASYIILNNVKDTIISTLDTSVISKPIRMFTSRKYLKDKYLLYMFLVRVEAVRMYSVLIEKEE